jgi:L-2,4-diaminobutyrate decarboxylase
MEATVARLCYPRGEPGAVITSGGTESTLLGLLLAKQDAAGTAVQVICTRGARPGVSRAVGQLGMPVPIVLDSFDALPDTLAKISTATAVVATAGTADTGAIDPLRTLAKVCRVRGTWVHVDATGGGAALFSERLRPLLDGLELADSVTLELPELGVGLLAARDAELLTHVRPAGRPDVSAAFRACRGRLAATVEHRCHVAAAVADAIRARPGLRLWDQPALSTVVFRPEPASAELVVDAHNRLLAAGASAISRATVDGQVWLKLAVSEPVAALADCLPLLDLVESVATRLSAAITVGDGTRLREP